MWARSKSTGSDCCATPSPRRLKRELGSRRCGCRRDQLERVFAVPFGRAGYGGDLAALAVDQYRGRHAQRPAYAFKVLKNLVFCIAKIAEPGQLGVFEETLRLFGVAGVDIDRDHLEIL